MYNANQDNFVMRSGKNTEVRNKETLRVSKDPEGLSKHKKFRKFATREIFSEGI